MISVRMYVWFCKTIAAMRLMAQLWRDERTEQLRNKPGIEHDNDNDKHEHEYEEETNEENENEKDVEREWQSTMPTALDHRVLVQDVLLLLCDIAPLHFAFFCTFLSLSINFSRE